MTPAGLDLRLCDFRYHKATEIWDRDHDMQLVRSALFHRRTATSAGYVARGMTSKMRVATDPVSNMLDNMNDKPHRLTPSIEPKPDKCCNLRVVEAG